LHQGDGLGRAVVVVVYGGPVHRQKGWGQRVMKANQRRLTVMWSYAILCALNVFGLGEEFLNGETVWWKVLLRSLAAVAFGLGFLSEKNKPKVEPVSQ
jgi:hypothetical protein